MSTTAKVAYLKGLAEGLQIDKSTKEGKLFTAIIDVLDEIALDIEDLGETTLELSEDLDELSDDLSELEDYCAGDYSDDEDDDDDDNELYAFPGHVRRLHDAGCCCPHEIGADDEDDDDGEPVFYEVTCPKCGNTITVDEDVLLLEEIDCPNCGELLEFDIEEEDDDGNDDDID